MVNWFDYNGVNSYADLSALVQTKSIFSSAAPDITTQEIPGRSGDLIFNNNRFKNIDVQYTCALIVRKGGFAEAARKVRTALLAAVGEYKRLADSYDAGYFRLATIKKEITIDQKKKYDGTVKVTFNCKPYFYSFAGQLVKTITTPCILTNYEKAAALPLIKIFGSGDVTLEINGKAFNLSAVDGYIEIDSERLAVYKDGESASAKTNCQEFPALLPGSNSINWRGNVQRLEITPRWRAL